MADPIVTVDEIDEALWWVVLTAPRDANYSLILDALLDQRNYLAHASDRGEHVSHRRP